MTSVPVAYYNEIDAYAAQWLRNLIDAGHIASGVVDERDIRDVLPADLVGFTQCHFFAGIGVWSHALRRAGWDDDVRVWTGSCPCQPFSAAGKGGGFADERHLWPAFHHLVRECLPPVVLGEQVASRDGLDWLDLVQDDMEGTGYAFGAVDTGSALHGAPHIRQRLRWVAYADRGQFDGLAIIRRAERDRQDAGRPQGGSELGARRDVGLVAHAQGDRGGTGLRRLRPAEHGIAEPANGRAIRVLGDPGAAGLQARERKALGGTGRREEGRAAQQPSRSSIGRDGGAGPTNGFWRDPDWLRCRDGRWRPVESGTFPLADGAPSRVGRLRAYGNAVCAEATTAFIRCLP